MEILCDGKLFDQRFLPRNFDDAWKSTVIEAYDPPTTIISCLAFSFFDSSTSFQRPNKLNRYIYIRFLEFQLPSRIIPTRFSKLAVVSIIAYSLLILLLTSRYLEASTICLKVVLVGHFQLCFAVVERLPPPRIPLTNCWSKRTSLDIV